MDKELFDVLGLEMEMQFLTAQHCCSAVIVIRKGIWTAVWNWSGKQTVFQKMGLNLDCVKYLAWEVCERMSHK